MKTLLKMAWRNLWRNRRRTLINLASVFFGVLLATFMSSMQEGSYANFIDNITRFYSGHLQIQDTAWWEERSVNNAFEPDSLTLHRIATLPWVENITPRLESFALASKGTRTRGSLIMGIDPEKENRITHLAAKIQQGQYLNARGNQILVASGLARYLGVMPGDTLALISQGWHGSSAAGLFLVSGIIKYPNISLDNQLIIMPIEEAKNFYGTEGRITSLVILLDHPRHLRAAEKEIKSMIKPGLRVMDWRSMQPELVQQIESDKASNGLMKLLLYVLIAFGILSTVIMMMRERQRELGVVAALGMNRIRLQALLSLEIFILSLLGVGAGLLASLPLIGWFVKNPIPLQGKAAEAMIMYGWDPYMFFSAEAVVFYRQALIVFILSLLVILYPLLKINRMQVARWLHK